MSAAMTATAAPWSAQKKKNHWYKLHRIKGFMMQEEIEKVISGELFSRLLSPREIDFKDAEFGAKFYSACLEGIMFPRHSCAVKSNGKEINSVDIKGLGGILSKREEAMAVLKGFLKHKDGASSVLFSALVVEIKYAVTAIMSGQQADTTPIASVAAMFGEVYGLQLADAFRELRKEYAPK